MSVGISIVREEIVVMNGEPTIQYQLVYPPNFDRTPKADPEFPEWGLFSPENPWSMNLTHRNFSHVMESLGLSLGAQPGEELEGSGDWYGNITNLSDLIERCQGVFQAARACPELDPALVSSTDAQPGQAMWVDCGRSEGYLTRQTIWLAELAKIAITENAILSYNG